MGDDPDNVAILPTGKLPDPEASGEVIDLLQSMLADARSGKIVGVAVAGICPRDDPENHMVKTDWAYAGSVAASELLGSIEILKARLVEHIRG